MDWMAPGIFGRSHSGAGAAHAGLPQRTAPMEKTHTGGGEKCEESEALNISDKHYGLTPTPIPHSLVPLKGKMGEEERVAKE